MKNLIVLSGNIGTGLTMYGDMLADRLGYDWLPEDSFISTYEKIHRSTERDYCLLSLIENIVNKVTYVNNLFLKGKETVIIERFLLDELVRFYALMDLYAIKKHINVYDNLIKLLDEICCDINIGYILIKTDLKTLKERNLNRQERFKYIVNDSIIEKIEKLYQSQALLKRLVFRTINSDSKNNDEIFIELSMNIEIYTNPLNFTKLRSKII